MRSAWSSGDLTTRARIRNAAVELFGGHGFDRTSVRMIAEAAHVSPALVVHHFGSKTGLRAACDEHVATVFTTEPGGSETTPTIEGIQAAMSDLDAYGPALAYLTRMLSEDSDAADALFDGLLRGTRRMLAVQQEAGLIHQQDDLDATTLLITLFGLAPLVLSRQFARSLGEARLTPAALARITLPTMELLTHGLYRDDALLHATRAALGATNPTTTHEEATDDGSD